MFTVLFFLPFFFLNLFKIIASFVVLIGFSVIDFTCRLLFEESAGDCLRARFLPSSLTVLCFPLSARPFEGSLFGWAGRDRQRLAVDAQKAVMTEEATFLKSTSSCFSCFDSTPIVVGSGTIFICPSSFSPLLSQWMSLFGLFKYRSSIQTQRCISVSQHFRKLRLRAISIATAAAVLALTV